MQTPPRVRMQAAWAKINKPIQRWLIDALKRILPSLIVYFLVNPNISFVKKEKNQYFNNIL